MKKTITLIALTVVMFSFATGSFAQDTKSTVPENGYFVLVSNKNVAKVTTVRFYNNDNTMIYEEKVTGVEIDLDNKATVDQLNLGLEKALTAYNNNQKMTITKDLVASIIKK
jgi:hypothetical protein